MRPDDRLERATVTVVHRLFADMYNATLRRNQNPKLILREYQEAVSAVHRWRDVRQLAELERATRVERQFARLLDAAARHAVKGAYASRERAAEALERAPGAAELLHACVTEVSRDLYRYPAVMYHNVDTETRRRNRVQVRDIICSALAKTIAEAVPAVSDSEPESEPEPEPASDADDDDADDADEDTGRSRGSPADPPESPGGEEEPAEAPGVEEEEPLDSPGVEEEEPLESHGVEEEPLESPGVEEEEPLESPGVEEEPLESPGVEEEPLESPGVEEEPLESPGVEEGYAASAEDAGEREGRMTLIVDSAKTRSPRFCDLSVAFEGVLPVAADPETASRMSYEPFSDSDDAGETVCVVSDGEADPIALETDLVAEANVFEAEADVLTSSSDDESFETGQK